MVIQYKPKDLIMSLQKVQAKTEVGQNNSGKKYPSYSQSNNFLDWNLTLLVFIDLSLELFSKENELPLKMC